MENIYLNHSKFDQKGRRVTIAVQVKADELRFGLSTCSTKDQFSKKKGRQIAIGRAQKKPDYIYKTAEPMKALKSEYHSLIKQFYGIE